MRYTLLLASNTSESTLKQGYSIRRTLAHVNLVLGFNYAVNPDPGTEGNGSSVLVFMLSVVIGDCWTSFRIKRVSNLTKQKKVNLKMTG